MNLVIMLDWLSDIYNISHNVNHIESSFCRQIRILENSSQIKSDCFLYLTQNPEVISLLLTSSPSAFVIFYVNLNSDFLPNISVESDHIIFLYSNESFLTVFHTIQDIFERYHAWHKECINMILEEKELSDFLDHASKYLDNPIALFDPTGVVLYHTNNFKQSINGTLWEEVISFGFTPTEFILPDEHKRVMQEIKKGTKLIINTFRQDTIHHALTIPLQADGKPCGAFGMTDINEPFTEAQKALIIEISHLTEYVLKRQLKNFLQQDESNYYVTRLLQGFPPDEHATHYYLNSKNYHNKDFWYLYQFPLSDANYSQTRKAPYFNHLGRILPNSILLTFENSIVGICRLQDFDPSQETNLKKLENLLKQLSMKVLISSQFTQFTDLSIAYGQCQLLEKYTPDSDAPIYRFEDYFQNILYGILQENSSLKGFCHPSILSMWQSRNDSKRQWIYDLKHYLLNGRNIAETARTLNLHRNTLIYRLQKIEESLQLSLDYLNENMRLYLLLSCMICEILE